MTSLQRERANAILDLLIHCHTGRDHAINAANLAFVRGFCCKSATRRIREIVSALRKEGQPICSTYSGGYYYAANESEAKEYSAPMRKHSVSELAAISHVNKAAPTGQIRFTFEEGR